MGPEPSKAVAERSLNQVASALVKETILIGKTLSEGSGIVREYANDLEGVFVRRLGVIRSRGLTEDERCHDNGKDGNCNSRRYRSFHGRLGLSPGRLRRCGAEMER